MVDWRMIARRDGRSQLESAETATDSTPWWLRLLMHSDSEVLCAFCGTRNWVMCLLDTYVGFVLCPTGLYREFYYQRHGHGVSTVWCAYVLVDRGPRNPHEVAKPPSGPRAISVVVSLLGHPGNNRKRRFFCSSNSTASLRYIEQEKKI